MTSGRSCLRCIRLGASIPLDLYVSESLLYNLDMSLPLRLILGFLALFAAFWLLAMLVGWLWYVIVAVGVIAAIALVIWFFTRGNTQAHALQPLTRKLEQKATQELKSLEKRQRNGPQ
jgi:hypothetical protein